jgi:hypothetical protein
LFWCPFYIVSPATPTLSFYYLATFTIHEIIGLIALVLSNYRIWSKYIRSMAVAPLVVDGHRYLDD